MGPVGGLALQSSYSVPHVTRQVAGPGHGGSSRFRAAGGPDREERAGGSAPSVSAQISAVSARAVRPVGVGLRVGCTCPRSLPADAAAVAATRPIPTLTRVRSSRTDGCGLGRGGQHAVTEAEAACRHAPTRTRRGRGRKQRRGLRVLQTGVRGIGLELGYGNLATSTGRTNWMVDGLIGPTDGACRRATASPSAACGGCPRHSRLSAREVGCGREGGGGDEVRRDGGWGGGGVNCAVTRLRAV